jgi:hypothetical protein
MIRQYLSNKNKNATNQKIFAELNKSFVKCSRAMPDLCRIHVPEPPQDKQNAQSDE